MKSAHMTGFGARSLRFEVHQLCILPSWYMLQTSQPSNIKPQTSNLTGTLIVVSYKKICYGKRQRRQISSTKRQAFGWKDTKGCYHNRFEHAGSATGN